MLSTRRHAATSRTLYALYHDWSLAIAAYNCGPGNVNKASPARAASGGTSEAVYDHLPRETRGYVPAFIGATYAYAYHRLHDIECSRPPIPLATDTVRVDRLLHFGQVASTIDVPVENPAPAQSPVQTRHRAGHGPRLHPGAAAAQRRAIHRTARFDPCEAIRST